MKLKDVEPISKEELASLDASYDPFPPFSQWTVSITSREAGLDSLVSRLEKTMKAARKEQVDRVRNEMMRSAAWDTGAIENLYDTDRGLTLTVAMQKATWEAEVNERGEGVRALFEAQLAAYELVLDLVTQSKPISEAIIRRLHEVVTAPQEDYKVQTPAGIQSRELPKGSYKDQPNHVVQKDGSRHAYAPVAETPHETQRLVEELQSDQFGQADPVTQAAYAHYCFVAIHPFADGNGRVARALASIYTYRGCSIPFYVFDDEKDRYFDCLATADRGNYQPFNDFVLHWTTQGVTIMANKLEAAAVSPATDTAKRVEALLHARGGLTHAQLDKVARNFRDLLLSAIQQRIQETGRGFSIQAGIGEMDPPSVEGYRGSSARRSKAPTFHLGVTLQTPAEAKYHTRKLILIGKEEPAWYDLAVFSPQGKLEIGAKIADLEPKANLTLSPTTMMQLAIDSYADKLVNQALDAFYERADVALRKNGWLRASDQTEGGDQPPL